MLEEKIRRNVAQAVKEYMAQGGTAAELAQTMGKSRDVVYNWMSGKTGISVADLSRLCQVMGEDPAWILEVRI